MSKIHVPRGTRYGRLTVIEESFEKSQRAFLCRCDCGAEKVVRLNCLRRGTTKSCGCYGKEVKIKHGHLEGGKMPDEYKAFYAARNRCENPNNIGYEQYGGRGIEFRFESFKEFYNHIGPKPSKKHTIDRIDSNGHYEPGNVRWSTMQRQQNNRTNNHLITYDGRTQTIAQWSRELGFKDSILYVRLQRGWSIEKALNTPVHR